MNRYHFCWTLCAVILTISYSPANATDGKSTASKTYEEHWPLAQKAFAKGSYEEALSHYQQVVRVFPFEPSSRFEIARCQMRLNEPEKAIRALHAAVSFGWSDSKRLEETTEFRGLRTRDEFNEILADTRACQNETVNLIAGSKVHSKRPVALVVYLHGLGGGPRGELPYWRQVADDMGCVVVAPKAPTRLAPMLYGWQRPAARDSKALDFYDVAAAQQRIGEAIRRAQTQYSIDSNRIILAGFSQGAGAALHCFRQEPNRFRGVIGWGALAQSVGARNWIHAKATQHRVALIAGEYDPLLVRSRLIAKELGEAGVPHRLHVAKETGHEFSPNHGQLWRDAIEFVTEQ